MVRYFLLTLMLLSSCATMNEGDKSIYDEGKMVLGNDIRVFDILSGESTYPHFRYCDDKRFSACLERPFPIVIPKNLTYVGPIDIENRQYDFRIVAPASPENRSFCLSDTLEFHLDSVDNNLQFIYWIKKDAGLVAYMIIENNGKDFLVQSLYDMRGSKLFKEYANCH